MGTTSLPVKLPSLTLKVTLYVPEVFFPPGQPAGGTHQTSVHTAPANDVSRHASRRVFISRISSYHIHNAPSCAAHTEQHDVHAGLLVAPESVPRSIHWDAAGYQLSRVLAKVSALAARIGLTQSEKSLSPYSRSSTISSGQLAGGRLSASPHARPSSGGEAPSFGQFP